MGDRLGIPRALSILLFLEIDFLVVEIYARDFHQKWKNLGKKNYGQKMAKM